MHEVRPYEADLVQGDTPPAILCHHLGGSGCVVYSLPHDARQPADEGVAVRQRLRVADDPPQVFLSRSRQGQQAVLDLRYRLTHNVQAIPASVPTP